MADKLTIRWGKLSLLVAAYFLALPIFVRLVVWWHDVTYGYYLGFMSEDNADRVAFFTAWALATPGGIAFFIGGIGFAVCTASKEPLPGPFAWLDVLSPAPEAERTDG